MVDNCAAGGEPDIPQALGSLLGIWVLLTLEVRARSVARGGRADRAGFAKGDFELDHRDDLALSILVLIFLQLNNCQDFAYK